MGHLDPIAYTYEADHHCTDCAFARFGQDELGFVPAEAEDNEGNPVGAVAPWDEWYDCSIEECQVLSCGTCGITIQVAHNCMYDSVNECEVQNV